MAYDAEGNEVSRTDSRATRPRTNTTRSIFAGYLYDEAGNKARQRDGRSKFTYWEYDNLGRVISRRLPGTFNAQRVPIPP